MHQDRQSVEGDYPHGRGYGHDYMRGGEVFGGYGYSDRAEYTRRRGDTDSGSPASDTGERRRAEDEAQQS